jgi:KDO2-lipid IV(A) lauroyltransferase
MRGVARVFAALPSRWVLWIADRMAWIVYVVDRRGRTVGRQNLDAVFGDTYTPREKKAIVRASMRGSARAVALLLHAAPLTPERFRRWVDVPADVETALRETALLTRGAVVASAHIGSWEVLLGLASVFHDIMPTAFLVEPSVHPAIDRFLVYLRGSSRGASAPRVGGAQTLNAHVRKGGIAALLIDRNVRRPQGGIWAPFFGLSARTTPLAAILARRNEVPIASLYCMPQPGGRYRLRLGPEVAMDVRTDDLEADVLEITTRINRLLEEVIREQPEAWNWTLKRFKSRPTEELGDYPPYSMWDPG